MECKIGVYVCHCGANIASAIDVAKVTEYAKGLPSVVVARDYKFVCSDPGQDIIKNDIKEKGLNRVVVASCSPRLHEPTFRRVVAAAGLNPYLFEMANIREQCAWVHTDKEMATEKAKALVSAAVRRVFLHEPLETKQVAVNPCTAHRGGGHRRHTGRPGDSRRRPHRSTWWSGSRRSAAIWRGWIRPFPRSTVRLEY